MFHTPDEDFGRARGGIKDLRFHHLRHTFASWYMMNGGDLYERYAKLARQHIVRPATRHVKFGSYLNERRQK